VLAMFILFGIAMMIPLAQELLKVAPLLEIDHYLFIGGITLVWVVITKLILLLPGLRFYTE
jgi:hypothetical protein